MKRFAVLGCVLFLFASCAKSNKTIIRMQQLETGISTSPKTIEELENAIKKYSDRVADIQIAQSKIGAWHKVLGTRYLEAKMYGEALKSFETALEYYPDNQNLYYYVGLCAGYMSHASLDFEATGEPSEKRKNYQNLAVEAYSRAIEIEPRYVRALYGLSVLYVFELGEEEKAIPLLEKILTIEKQNVEAMFILARAYYMNYEYNKSVAMYDQIIATTKSKDRKAAAQENKMLVLEASNAGY